MNRKFTLLISLCVLCVLYSCQKIPGHGMTPGSGTTSGTTTTTTTTTTTPATGIDTSKGYFPVTANSYTKYRTVANGAIDTTTDVVTGATTTINSKPYYVVTANSTQYGSSTGYFSDINHAYTFRSTSVVYGVTLEVEYLVDNAPVGTTWKVPVTDNGSINGVPAQLIGTITEKGISRTVSGTTFSNVIHTTLLLQYDLGQGYQTTGTYQYYIAKGVGIIESDNVASLYGASITTTTNIIGFSIK